MGGVENVGRVVVVKEKRRIRSRITNSISTINRMEDFDLFNFIQ